MTDDDDKATERRTRSVLFILGFLVLVSAAAAYALTRGAKPADIALIGFVAFSAVIVAFAAAVLWQIIDGKIDLFGIVAEPEKVATYGGKPKASLSRFQFLVFTFVIAGLFLMLSIESGGFVNIPDNVLILLGLSGGGFLVSKTIGGSQARSVADAEAKAAEAKALADAAGKTDNVAP
ncbi:MAG: hypothetical protein PVG98_15135 [Chromatiales bacterium]|jgi:hypothetical protein